MTFIKDIIKESKSFAKFFEEKTNKDIYHHIEVALEGFHHLFVYIAQQGITICPIPSRLDDEWKIIQNKELMDILTEKAKRTGQVAQAAERIAAKEIDGTQIGSLTMVTDLVNHPVIQHELFHYVYDMLNTKTKSLIRSLYESADKKNALIDSRIKEDERNAEEEYFAHSGSAFMRDKRTLVFFGSNHDNLKEMDPEIYNLLNRILEGDSEYF
jgi:hypothetical protein